MPIFGDLILSRGRFNLSDNCTQTCNTCGEDCQERKEPQSLLELPHELSRIKKVIAVVSGKGGVGKSLVTSMLAVSMKRRGLNTAILDADITGPSIPKAFGITSKAVGFADGLLPVKSKSGIDIMSVNLLMSNDTIRFYGAGPSWRERSNNFGPMCSGLTSITCSSICRQGPVMYP